MHQLKKRLLCIILSVAMAVSLLPSTAFAEEASQLTLDKTELTLEVGGSYTLVPNTIPEDLSVVCDLLPPLSKCLKWGLLAQVL